MLGFITSKNRLTLSLEANAVEFNASENPRALKNYTISTLIMIYEWKIDENKIWMIAHLVYNTIY